jgi:hypothetical protein
VYFDPSVAAGLGTCRLYVAITLTTGQQNLLCLDGGSGAPANTPYFPFTFTAVTLARPTWTQCQSALDPNGFPIVLLAVHGLDSSFAGYGCQIQRSDDGGHTYNDIRQSPLILPSGASTEDFVTYDYEALPLAPSHYQARIITSGAVSPWNVNAGAVRMQTTMWDMMDPTNTDTTQAIQFYRVQVTGSTDAGSVQLGPPTSITIDQPEQQGVFRPIGAATAVVVRSAMQAEEFDLGMAFLNDNDNTWTQFVKLRNLQKTLMVRGDMNSQRYYVALGPTRPVQIMRDMERTTNPMRALSVHCTPVPKP